MSTNQKNTILYLGYKTMTAERKSQVRMPVYPDCCIYGDKGYMRADVQFDLFETTRIRQEFLYRLNQKLDVLYMKVNRIQR